MFQIDEHAYERLWRYLESIKARYANTKGGDDIIWDIENRLAEMFYEYLGTTRQVVGMADVEKTMTVMGRPEDFEIPLEDEDDEPRPSGTQTDADKKQRRLFRNGEDKVISGVASGISAYLGIHDPIWMRIAFVVALFVSFGTSLIVYIILMIIIPEAKTASEKLQMRGERINIDNIERTVRDELNDLEARLHSGKDRSSLSRLADYIAAGMRIALIVLGKIIGFSLAALGIVLLISLILGISIPSMMQGGIAVNMLGHLFNSTGTMVAAIVGIGLLLLIPILGLIYSGLAILLNRSFGFRGLGLTTFGLLVTGLVLTIYSVSMVNGEFDVERSRTETVVLSQPVDGILRLQLANDPRNKDGFKAFTGFGLLREENDTLFARNNSINTANKPIVLDIVRSPSKDFLLETTFTADGHASDAAYLRSQHIQYTVQQDSAHAYFPAYFVYPAADKIRDQQIKMILKVPEGKSVYLGKEVRELIYDIKNVTNTYDGDMVGHTWKMLSTGLTCMDCGHNEGFPPPPPPFPATPAMPPPPTGFSVPQPTFNTLKIDGSLTFYLVPAEETRIVFEEKEMEKWVSVNHSGNTLTIGNNTALSLINGRDVTVWIYTPTVNKVIASGASEGQVNGFTTDNFSLELSGASHCEMNVVAHKLTLRLSGASELMAYGNAAELDAEATGASHLYAFGLAADNAKVHTSGASNAEVNVSKKLEAQSTGASSINRMQQ